MRPEQQVHYILDECFLAVGQALGTRKRVDYDAIEWWRSRYHDKFLDALTVSGNSWDGDRDRVMAVSRWLGHRAMFHAGDRRSIDSASAAKAAAEIESGCRLHQAR